ncbi:MAG: 30S ribosome-binding factor RbfA [Deltaproteobacteria bacterium]|nr:MAG: 30S ribosome-binding factor RbfA [Deltaproteobacteria bacterium]
MLSGKRARRVGDAILKEIAYLLLFRVGDPRVKGVTLTGIRLSDDLKHARVYYSVMGDADEVKVAQAGLESAKGFIKREIGIRMELRYVPDLVFIYDPSLKWSGQMDRLLEEIKGAKGEE